MKNKIGAVLIGLMLIMTAFGAAHATSQWHSISVGPSGSQPVPGTIKLVDTLTGNVVQYASVNGVSSTTFQIERLVGTTMALTAVVEKIGYTSYTNDFTLSDTSGDKSISYNLVPNPNVNPNADFTATVNGLVVSVDASKSSDPDGDALTYDWDFGDGSMIGIGKTAVHAYAAAGVYTIKLTVDDAKGGVDTESISVTLQTMSSDVRVYDLNFKDEVAPGSTQNFELELKNFATYDAEDVTATIIIKGIAADKDDLETEIDFGTIDAGDKQTESVDITIPQDADDKQYTVIVDLEWEDSDGNKYTGTYTATDKITVEKVKHQISITSVNADATKYNPADTVQLAVSLLNTGANDETVAIRATSDIGVSVTSAAMKLREGDATTQYISFAVPEDTKAGKYFAVVSAAYGSYTASKTIVLEIASDEIPTVVSVVEPTTDEGIGANIPATEIALAVVILLLLGAIVWMAKDLIVKPTPARPVAVRAKR